MPDAVLFDLDGVLLDSEQRWNEAKEAVTREAGGRWRDEAAEAMMGMSAPEWSAYMRDELTVPLEAEAIDDAVVARMRAGYADGLPLLPGALDAVAALAAHWPLGLASSSNREIIDAFLDLSGLRDRFRAAVSSEEVGRGKPAPDVYLEVCRRLGVDPSQALAVEDAPNGILAAHAAGMAVVAIPPHFHPPTPDVLAVADVVIDSLDELTVELVSDLLGRR